MSGTRRDEITITTTSGTKIVLREGESKSLAGLNIKKMYDAVETTPEGDKVTTKAIGKTSKERHIKDIFDMEILLGPKVFQEWQEAKAVVTTLEAVSIRSGLTKEEAETLEINKARKQDIEAQYTEKLKQAEKSAGKHRDEVRDTHAFLEVLGPVLARNVFSDLIIVPENYYQIDKGIPWVYSKLVNKLSEFLSDAPIVKDKKDPAQWDQLLAEGKPLPERADFNLTEAQAKFLGQLYYVALLFGHWDLLNNINLTNSGLASDSTGEEKAAIVDWGNCLGVAGFSAKHPDQNSFEYKGLLQLIQTLTDSKLTGFLSLEDEKSVRKFQACVPFSSVVYPILPRQVVHDLFKMSGDDVISKAMLEGFKSAHEKAVDSLAKHPNLVKEAVQETMESYVAEKDVMHLIGPEGILNKEYFSLTPSFSTSTSTSTERKQKSNDSLEAILPERLQSLGEMIIKLQAGIPMEKIATERLMAIAKSQIPPSQSMQSSVVGVGFYKKPKEEKIGGLQTKPPVNPLSPKS